MRDQWPNDYGKQRMSTPPPPPTPSARALLGLEHRTGHPHRYEAWTNITKGEDNLFAAAGQKLPPVSLVPADGRGDEKSSTFSTNAASAPPRPGGGQRLTAEGKGTAVYGDGTEKSGWGGLASSVGDAVGVDSLPRDDRDGGAPSGGSLAETGSGGVGGVRGRLKKWRKLPLVRSWLKNTGSEKGAPAPRGSSPEGVAGLGDLASDRPGDGLSSVSSAGGGGGGREGGGVGSGAAAKAEPPARAVRRGAKRWQPEARLRDRYEDGGGGALEGERGGGGGGEASGSREFRRKRWKG